MTAKFLKPHQIETKIFWLNPNSFYENLVWSYYGSSFSCRSWQSNITCLILANVSLGQFLVAKRIKMQ